MMDAEYFDSRVERVPESGCWIWMGALTDKGYGKFRSKTLQYAAHRKCYEAHRGPIPNGLCVLHRCDIPSCINPAHLFLGTRADNVVDMCAKNRVQRHGRGGAIGESNPNTKLTDTQVLQLRAMYPLHSSTELAAMFGIQRAQAWKIAVGLSRRKVYV